MAKTINLTPGPKPPAATSREDLQVPPPASLPPGVTSGRPPLPLGQVVTAANPARLTAEEAAKLERIGWRRGQPIPADAAKIITELEQSARAEAAAGARVPPVDPSTPPVTLNPVAIESLSPADQQRYQEALAAGLQREAATKAEAAVTQRLAAESNSPLKARQLDLGTAEAPLRPAPNFVPDPYYQPAAPAPLPVAAPAGVAEGGGAPQPNCPHCGWDMSAADIPEPPYEEKITFLQAILGEQNYTREYPLLGGAVQVTFRVLTTREIDAIFQQVYREQERGEIKSEFDHFERVNRLRTYLQLLRLRTTGNPVAGGFDHELPDGLDVLRAPHATAYWELPPVPTGTEPEPLKAIEKYMLDEVLRNEVINRLVQQTCNRFNRMVAKLEVLTDNEGFWKATGAQS